MYDFRFIYIEFFLGENSGFYLRGSYGKKLS